MFVPGTVHDVVFASGSAFLGNKTYKQFAGSFQPVEVGVSTKKLKPPARIWFVSEKRTYIFNFCFFWRNCWSRWPLEALTFAGKALNFLHKSTSRTLRHVAQHAQCARPSGLPNQIATLSLSGWQFKKPAAATMLGALKSLEARRCKRACGWKLSSQFFSPLQVGALL